jgi:hypothetical protein
LILQISYPCQVRSLRQRRYFLVSLDPKKFTGVLVANFPKICQSPTIEEYAK